MDSKPRKISPSTDSTVPISRMDMELYNYDTDNNRATMYNINKKSGAMNVVEDMEIIRNKSLEVKISTD
jgi:hypothetical protein